MWFELGNHKVWYIHGYECFGRSIVCVYIGHQVMEAVGSGQIICVDHLGLIFWGNSHYSNTIFRMQKRAIRVIMGLRSRDSCREHFKKLKILPRWSQYIQLLLLFVVDNKRDFKENSDIHNINTRSKSNLHQPIDNLSKYQKGAYYSGINP